MSELFTYEEWRTRGMQVQRGEASRVKRDGMPVFSRNQVKPWNGMMSKSERFAKAMQEHHAKSCAIEHLHKKRVENHPQKKTTPPPVEEKKPEPSILDTPPAVNIIHYTHFSILAPI